MEYHIVSDFDAFGLVGVVNSLIKLGWKPQGGPFEHLDLDGRVLISQALVRKPLTT